MKFIKNNFASIYISLMLVSIYSPDFNVYDKMASQIFYISVINTLALISIPIIFKKFQLNASLKHPLILMFLGYVIFALLSMIKAINVVESLVRMSQILTFFFSLLIIVFIVSKKLLKINFVLSLIALSLSVDIFFSLAAYLPFVLNDIPFQYKDNTILVGLYGNRNILATILAFKIPLVIILAQRFKSNYMYFFAFFLITTAFFNIFLLSSRATYLAIILSVLFVFSFEIFRNFKQQIKPFVINKYFLFLYFIPLIIALSISQNAIDELDEGNVVNRISTITSANDSSKNTRLRYYSQSIDHITKNPLLGGGIGNWKIISIKYDSKNIKNYVIPYNAHNDVLEAAAETGIIGGLSFLSFFIIILYYLLGILKKHLSEDKSIFVFLILTLPFISYFIDLNLNFPSSRPSNQVLLLLYIGIILTFKFENNAKE
jgi:O-antigen ligase